MILDKPTKTKKLIDREFLVFCDWHGHHEGKYYNRSNPKYFSFSKDTTLGRSSRILKKIIKKR